LALKPVGTVFPVLDKGLKALPLGVMLGDFCPQQEVFLWSPGRAQDARRKLVTPAFAALSLRWTQEKRRRDALPDDVRASDEDSPTFAVIFQGNHIGGC
jgi:hypothetical protein